MAEAVPSSAGTAWPPASQWPLRRYARFEPPAATPLGSTGSSAAAWKVLESNKESGSLTLNIVASGHFFISQGQTLLEGFSLIDAQKWLKIRRQTDCLLFGSKVKNESRMFRVQFSGESKEQSLEHCCYCTQMLQAYITVQDSEEHSQELLQADHDLVAEEDKLPPDALTQHMPSQCAGNSRMLLKPSTTEGRMSLMQLAQSMLTRNQTERPLAYQHSAWNAVELGPFLRMCLMDQHFPAFVEEVEKELQKLSDG